jgi:hypothetical protein
LNAPVLFRVATGYDRTHLKHRRRQLIDHLLRELVETLILPATSGLKKGHTR